MHNQLRSELRRRLIAWRRYSGLQQAWSLIYRPAIPAVYLLGAPIIRRTQACPTSVNLSQNVSNVPNIANDPIIHVIFFNFPGEPRTPSIVPRDVS